MINKNELRFGNFVSDVDGKTMPITTIERDGVTLLRFYLNQTEKHPDKTAIISDVISFDKINSIPLTEEWLIKFGARKLEFWDGYFSHDRIFDVKTIYRPYFIGDCVIGELDGIFYFLAEFRDDTKPIGNPISAPISFVHTLQNYYPAFSGKELTIKI